MRLGDDDGEEERTKSRLESGVELSYNVERACLDLSTAFIK